MSWLYQSKKRGFRERPKRSEKVDDVGLIVTPFRIPYNWLRGLRYDRIDEGVLAIDIETNAKPWWSGQCRIQTIALCDEHGAVAYDMCKAGDRRKCFLRIRAANGWVFHNNTYDLMILVMAGYLLPESKMVMHDTIQMARVANNLEPLVGLDALGKKYCKKGKVEVKKCWLLPKKELLEYNLVDAEITWELYQRYLMRKDIEDWWPTYAEQEMPMNAAVISMMIEGVALDYEWCIAFFQGVGGDIKDHCALFPEGLNHRSGAQVSEWLFGPITKEGGKGHGGLLTPRADHPLCKPTKARPYGYYSTAEDEVLLYPEGKETTGIELLLATRELEKNFTFVKGLVKVARWNGRVHTTLMPYTAKTGRWSARNPALQTIPGEPYLVRCAFLEEDGYELWTYDYDQMELRVMASESGEEKWITCLSEGGDPHAVNAKALGISRDHAKRVIYCWMFGGGAATMAATVRQPEAYGQKIVQGFRKGLPKASRYMAKRKLTSKKDGKFYTPYGRKLRVMEDYQATDYTIQGGCADLLKQRITVIGDYLCKHKLRTMMIFPIHDELVFKVYKSEKKKLLPKLRILLEDRETFTVPLTVGMGRFHEKY